MGLKEKIRDDLFNIFKQKIQKNTQHYSIIQKQLASVLFILGPASYKIQEKILKMPSTRTVQRFYRDGFTFHEGKLELIGPTIQTFQKSASNIFWGGEDATRIQGKLIYCEKTNQIIGYSRKLGELRIYFYFPYSYMKYIQYKNRAFINQVL